MAQIISQDYSRLVGVPYLRMNCWELSREFYRIVFGISLKHYYIDRPKERKEYQDMIYTNIGDFTKVSDPEFGDLVLLKIKGLESHIAVYVGEGKILHTSKNTGSVIEPISRWGNLIGGYYRV